MHGPKSERCVFAYRQSDIIFQLAIHKRSGMPIRNLFTDAAAPHQGEHFDTLLSHRNLVIERIVSSATMTPKEYVQSQDEWVLLVKGEAVLQVAG